MREDLQRLLLLLHKQDRRALFKVHFRISIEGFNSARQLDDRTCSGGHASICPLWFVTPNCAPWQIIQKHKKAIVPITFGWEMYTYT